jgi:hypothetical protein
MKPYYLLTALLITTFVSLGQAPLGQISILRANDNFASVKNDTAKKGFNKWKHIPLSNKTNISFGGELREQLQYFENFGIELWYIAILNLVPEQECFYN